MTAPDPRAWLDAVDARTNAATTGPWEADFREVSQSTGAWLPVVSAEVSCSSYCYGGSARGVEREEDAEFIASARTDLPAATTALRAVLNLHDRRPYDTIRDGVAFGQTDYPDLCAECRVPTPYPCQTVTVITTALEDA